MLTHTMTYKQMQEEFFYDMNNLLLPHLIKVYDKRAKRAILKTTKFPIIFNPVYYTSKRQNRWIIMYYAIDKKLAHDASCVILLTVNTPEGVYVYRKDMGSFDMLITVYPPHFFSRYRSRQLKDNSLTTEEVIIQFFKNNFDGIIARRDNIAESALREGYALGEVLSREYNLTMMKTFITSKMLREDQSLGIIWQNMDQDEINFLKRSGNKKLIEKVNDNIQRARIQLEIKAMTPTLQQEDIKKP
ncbi:hypothetical protein SAMN05444405_102167 [Bacteroides luti]|uniref:Uncharacterized protein n=1 Tax=Bacteroides luti TaxID=1297750 RepID=A0A1M4UT58_9BACE|nr:hypothetical protein [Bacteroides luti]SHE59916.1 hypothetical protein SAMN05444405_102167 [Bacteroides luti]